MTDDLGFLPPQNLEAERAILSACLMDRDAIGKIAELQPHDFYKNQHGKLFETMLKLRELDEPIDMVTLDGKADKAFLHELAIEFVTAANVNYHAKIIKEESNKRQLIAACSRTIQEINENSLDESLTNLRNLTGAIVSGRSGSLVSYKNLMAETSEFIEDRYNHKGKLSGIPSGFIDLDDFTDGWQKSELIILGARPGMGKSALSQVFCENAGVPAGIIQIEMGRVQTGIRAVARDSEISLWKLRKGYLSGQDWPQLHGAIARLAAKEIYIDFASRKISDIEKTFTKMVELHGVKFVVIDYLQLAEGNSNTRDNKSRAQEVADTSKLLKHMAKQHEISVIALAQLNRDIEKRKGKPILSDLKESGQIEQDADIVIFLYDENDMAVLDIAKARNGGLGQVYLLFDKDRMQFRNSEKKREA